MRNTELSILVVVPMFLAVISATAFAEPPTPPPLPSGFNEFILSDQHKNAVLDIAKKTQSQIQGTCQTLGLSFTGKFAVFVPIQMGENGLPTSGIWKELVSATGCKESYFFNVLAVIDASHALSMVPLIPGDGLADPYLIRDAKPMVLQAVGLKKAGCDQKQVIRTKFEEYLGDPIPTARNGPNSRRWAETWKVWACGDIFDIAIIFTPNEKGTGFMIPSQIKPN